MKKLLIMCFILFLLAGCTRVDNMSITELSNEIISSNTSITNIASKGYKYYLPKGVSLVIDNDFNHQLIISDNKAYLYVDVVSYYYKNQDNYYEVNNNYYCFYELKNGNKKGYLKIIRDNSQFYVEIVYNYAKIELYTSEDKLKESVLYSLIVLSSIEYNNLIINNIISTNDLTTVDKKYSLIKPKESENNFLENAEKYNIYEESTYELPD